MFRGLHAVQLDEKGRMGIPKRYRAQLQAKHELEFVVTIDTACPCLLVYPFPEWEIIERRLEALPSFNQAARRIQRLLIGHATELTTDSQGRILLPPLLREYAHLEKSLVVVGQGTKFEVWSESIWQQHRHDWLTQEDTEELPEELKKLSL